MIKRGYIDNKRKNENEFNAHLKNKKLLKELEIYCYITGTNKTRYVEEATMMKLANDMETIKSGIKNDRKAIQLHY